MIIVLNIKAVDQAILSVDEDRTVLRRLKRLQMNMVRTIILPSLTAVIKTTKPYQNVQSVEKWASSLLMG